MQGSRPARVGDQIREELSELLTPHVKVSPDLQVARVFYTLLGDEKARKETSKALDRATPFLRRQIAGRLRLRRAPELTFAYDESIAKQQRIEQLIEEIHAADAAA